MRTSVRTRIVVASLAGFAAVAWALNTTRAHTPPAALIAASATGAGGAIQESEPRERADRVYLSAPISAEVAKTWAKLQQKVAMPFASETPFEDVIQYIKTSTADPNDKGPGLQIYVDPIGLQEVEKTMTSPVTLNLEGLPLTTTLGLVLKQLGMVYTVQKDGLVVITSKESEDASLDPNMAILDELAALRSEVKALRSEIAGMSRTTTAPSGVEMHSGGSTKMMGGMGGGMR